MGAPRIYLAGPDVFHPDAIQLGIVKKALCADHGFVGLYPLDHDLGGALCDASRTIYRGCLAMMRDADAGIFNLTPFRGPSADVGTVLELGMMAAMGKPLFAYTDAAGDLIDRLRESPGLVCDAATASWCDPDGMSAEDFGNADNLMLDETLAAQGRRIHRCAVPAERRYADTSGLVTCLEEARAYFEAVRARPDAARP